MEKWPLQCRNLEFSPIQLSLCPLSFIIVPNFCRLVITPTTTLATFYPTLTPFPLRYSPLFLSKYILSYSMQYCGGHNPPPPGDSPVGNRYIIIPVLYRTGIIIIHTTYVYFYTKVGDYIITYLILYSNCVKSLPNDYVSSK